ncbi:MAG: maleylpyruvate isomerase family mycothiol-dependent enzyme [Acidimicrobiales bacterium]
MRALYPNSLNIELIRLHAHGLASIADETGPDALVPTCGDWTLADLTWHLLEVQTFWSWIIENRPASPDSYTPPPRPPDAELPDGLRIVANRLVGALDDLEPSEPAWSWSGDHTVGFTIRRQIHEALVHHIDGVLAAGNEIPAIEPLLAADGVDEMVTIMVAHADLGDLAVELTATDTDDRWFLGTGSEGVPIAGDATPLNLWLWGRADAGTPNISGDASAITRLREVIISQSQ